MKKAITMRYILVVYIFETFWQQALVKKKEISPPIQNEDQLSDFTARISSLLFPLIY